MGGKHRNWHRAWRRDTTDKAKTLIAEESYTPQLGARPVKRYIQRNIETLLGKEIIKGTLEDNSTVTIDVEDDNIVIKK